MASTAAIAQDKVIRVLRSPVGTFQGLFIAEEQGYFAEKGLKVEISIGGSPDQNVAQLQAGQTDLIMTAAASVSTAVAQGLPLLAVLNTQDQGDTPTTGLQVPPNSPIKTVADLKGKKIGISGVTSPQAIALYRALRTAGMTPADVTLVNMGFDTMIKSAERATVDAIMPVGLFYPLAGSKGFTAIPEVYNEIKGTAAVIFATSKAFADANGEALKAFTEAMLKAYEYANANPDAVRAVDTRADQDAARLHRHPLHRAVHRHVPARQVGRHEHGYGGVRFHSQGTRGSRVHLGGDAAVSFPGRAFDGGFGPRFLLGGVDPLWQVQTSRRRRTWRRPLRVLTPAVGLTLPLEGRVASAASRVGVPLWSTARPPPRRQGADPPLKGEGKTVCRAPSGPRTAFSRRSGLGAFRGTLGWRVGASGCPRQYPMVNRSRMCSGFSNSSTTARAISSYEIEVGSPLSTSSM